MYVVLLTVVRCAYYSGPLTAAAWSLFECVLVKDTRSHYRIITCVQYIDQYYG